MNASLVSRVEDLVVRLNLVPADRARKALAAWHGDGSPLDWLVAQDELDLDDAEHLEHFLRKQHEPDSDPSEDATLHAPLPPRPRTFKPESETTPAQRYRLIAIHATGGMGRVWIAEDAILKRRVAVKELRPDLRRNDEIEQRFLQEVRVTATLEHPGIVPIYDLAGADSGEPTYVMRFMEGKTLGEEIRAYHEARRRGTADRMALVRLLQAMVTVCQTVGFAHSRNVLHRDLKPANILLGAFGEVLVLDWGLAKQLGSDESPSSVRVPAAGEAATGSQSATVAGQVLGTPAYMAPEQAAGHLDRLDPRTDVFGLGAILYEVLTGTAPFAKSGTRDGQRPAPPSPRSVDSQLSPALDAICMKALSAQPEARYASASALADDLQRWLADEPVHAYPEPWTTRLGRWTRRHRAAVFSVLALLVMGVIGLGATSVLVDQQRRRAETNAQLALDAVESFLVKISEERLLYEPGMQPLRAELLLAARTFGERFVEESKGDPARHGELARTLTLLGASAAMSGDTKQAMKDLTLARTIYRDLLRRSPDNARARAGMARCQLEIGKVARQAGLSDAETELLDAAERYAEEPESADSLRFLALGENELGLLYINTKKPTEARTHLDRAIEVAERVVKLEPQSWLHQNNLATYASGLGEWLKNQGKRAEAKDRLHFAMEIRQRLIKNGVRNPLVEEALAQSHNNLGYLSLHDALAEKQRGAKFKDALRSAEEHFQAEYQLCVQLARRNPAVPRYRERLAVARYNRSRIPAAKGQFDDAILETLEGVRILEALFEEIPESPFAKRLARLHLDLSYYQNDAERFADVLTTLERVDQLAGGLLKDASFKDDGRAFKRDAWWQRAQTLANLRRFADSVKAYDEAIQWADEPQRKVLRAERQSIAEQAP